jgi:hypothetical protein
VKYPETVNNVLLLKPMKQRHTITISTVQLALRTWIKKSMKTEKIGPDRFLWFIENQSVIIQKFEILRNLKKMITGKISRFTIFI